MDVDLKGSTLSRTRSGCFTCTISRSGFSGERVFRVRTADGEDYIGGAPVHYFLTRKGEPLPADAATSPGQEVEGRITALLIESNGVMAIVSFPGGETIQVKSDQLHPLSSKANFDVPV